MGMNIGAKNYDDAEYQKQLARLDVVILGFYKGWKPRYGMAKVVRNLKELSGGKILVGQYTILNESGDDPKNTANLDTQTQLNEMKWWARKADGSRVQWTAQYRARDINFTAGSRPDANGRASPSGWPIGMTACSSSRYLSTSGIAITSSASRGLRRIGTATERTTARRIPPLQRLIGLVTALSGITSGRFIRACR